MSLFKEIEVIFDVCRGKDYDLVNLLFYDLFIFY